MAAHAQKRRLEEDAPKSKQKVRVKKQVEYHSSSEDDCKNEDAALDMSKAQTPSAGVKSGPKPILKQSRSGPKRLTMESHEDEAEDADTHDTTLSELALNTALNTAVPEDEDASEEMTDDEPAIEGSEPDSASESEKSTNSSNAMRAKKKRNDPDAFATSISKILETKLSSSKRQDPVLSRSKSAAEAQRSLADTKIDEKARQQIRAEKKQSLENGRIRDVLGLQNPGVDTGAVQEKEKRLKKVAQRGVVKLFNAVRAAQAKAEEAERNAKMEGVVGSRQREEKVNELSKQGFLDLISRGGKANLTA